jgi:hypothetical protein
MLAGELLNSLIRKESHTREPKTKNEKPGETLMFSSEFRYLSTLDISNELDIILFIY